MKRIDDNKVKELLINNKNYKISSSSEDILNKSLKTPSLEEKSKKKKLIFGSIFGTLSTALACGFVAFAVIKFGGSNQPGITHENIVQLEVNNKEVGVFSSFYIDTNEIVSKNVVKKLNITQNGFETSMRIYEKMNNGINNIFNNATSTTYEGKYEKNKKEYKYRMIYKINNKEISDFYFNVQKNDYEQEILGKIYFNESSKEYNVYSKQEIDNDEQEIETLFYNDEKNDIFSVKEEKEFEGKQTENSYSFYSFSSMSSYENENYVYGFEYEIEDDEMQLNYHENNKEYEFSAISKISDTKFEFNYAHEDDELDIEIDSRASLEYGIEDEKSYHLYKDLNNLELFLKIYQ